jgi:hypothetical protein
MSDHVSVSVTRTGLYTLYGINGEVKRYDFHMPKEQEYYAYKAEVTPQALYADFDGLAGVRIRNGHRKFTNDCVVIPLPEGIVVLRPGEYKLL